MFGDIKTRLPRWTLICLFALVSPAVCNTRAALQAFIRFQQPLGGAMPYQGSSTDTQFPANQGWSELPYFNAAMQNIIDTFTQVSAAHFEPICLAKPTDIGSPGLFKTCAVGGHYGDVQMMVRDSNNGNPFITFEARMSDVFVTGLHWIGTTTDAAQETVTLVTTGLQVTQRSVTSVANGGITVSQKTAHWSTFSAGIPDIGDGPLPQFNSTPTISCRADETVACASPTGSQFAERVTVSDSDSGQTLTLTLTESGTVLGTKSIATPATLTDVTFDAVPLSLGTHTLMVAVSDGVSQATCSRTVTIKTDTTPPVPDLDVLPTIAGQCSATIATAPTATDACSGPITGTTTEPLTYTLPGSYNVTWKFKDSAGNEATQVQTISVKDTLAPVPAAVSLPDVSAQCSASRPAAPTALDNCEGLISGTTSAPLTFGPGDYTITWMFADSRGNLATQNQNVRVHDTLPPIFSSVSANIQAAATSLQGAIVQYANAVATDNCSAVSLFYSKASGTMFPLGTTLVSVTAKDASGNAVQATFTVTVAFAWSGALSPVNADGTSVCKAGSTVPVKFKLTGASANISNLNATLTYVKISDNAPGEVNEAVSTSAATSGNLFRLDGGQYIFNWSTRGLSAGLYELSLELGDGVARKVRLGLK